MIRQVSQLRDFAEDPTFAAVTPSDRPAADSPPLFYDSSDFRDDAVPSRAAPVSRALALRLGATFTVVVAAVAVDLVLDRPSSWWSAHVMVEVSILLMSLGSAAALWRALRRTTDALRSAHGQLRNSHAALTSREAERDAWRKRAEGALNEFATVVDQQLLSWRLTVTEREVALLLLQGLGHRDVALRMGRSERTVRQHAVAVYGKAGVGSRSELAAFFLRDALPVTTRPVDGSRTLSGP